MRAVDLFCGGGLASAGAREAGFAIAGAVDAWDVAAQTYGDNFPDARVVTTRLVDGSGPVLFGDLGKIDLLIASPECTNHSIARGNRPPDEVSRRSGWYVVPFAQQLSPRWIVIENVIRMRQWPDFNDWVAALKRLYRIQVIALDAADFGVPQNRRRLFIVGDRLKEPTIVKASVTSRKPAALILERIIKFPAEPVYNGKRASSTVKRVERGISELGRKRDFLIVYYGSDRAGGWQPLDRPLRTLTTLDRFALVQWEGNEPTLRMLQVPELKRAMGLDCLRDERGGCLEFQLNHGTRRDKVRILGNGVCAPVMRAIVGSLLGAESCDLVPSAETLYSADRAARRVTRSNRARWRIAGRRVKQSMR